MTNVTPEYGQSPAMQVLPTIKLWNEINEIDLKISELRHRRDNLIANWERDHPRASWWKKWLPWAVFLLYLTACTELGTHGGRYESSRALWEAGDRLQTQGQAMILESRLQMMNAAIMAPRH